MTTKIRLPFNHIDINYKIATDKLLILLSIFEKWNPIAVGCCEDEGSDNCPICRYYEVNCVLCPIFKKTGEDSCFATPYTKFSNTSKKDPVIYDIIEEEIEFLISLLDEKTQKDLENIFIDWCENGDKQWKNLNN